MRAMVADAYGQPLHLMDLPQPTPGPGQVRVRVEAAALNPADSKVLAGGFTASILHAKTFPLVVGYDFAGRVDALGEGVSDLAVGAAVFGFLPYSGKNTQGSLCESVVVPANAVAVFSGVSAAEAAAAATTACTALQSLRDKGRLPEGGRVWVNGASGGVGTQGVQIGRLLGAEVWGSCSAAKADYVRALGATTVLDYRTTPLPDDGTRFDVIFDAAATTSYGRCRHLLTPKGVYVTTLPGLSLIWGMVLSAFSGRASRFVAAKSPRGDLETIASWMASGALKTPIEASFPLESTNQGLALLASGKVMGKVAISI